MGGCLGIIETIGEEIDGSGDKDGSYHGGGSLLLLGKGSMVR